MHATQQLAVDLGNTRRACEALLASRATLYRHARPRLVQIARPRPAPPRALSTTERSAVLDVLHSPRFQDLAPAQVHATLLDESTYLCSARTMHRVLAGRGESHERRAVRRHPPVAVPRLVATAPNQVWTWDITKLPGPVKGVFFALYVVLDLFSRFVVGWTIARQELASIAEALLRESCQKHGVRPGQLKIHSDRGTQMTAKPIAMLFAELGIIASLSRPRVSNDNPYSESHFRTTKYSPSYPGRFGSTQHGRAWAGPFFNAYNAKHHHSGLAMLTPEDVFMGRAQEILDRRRATLRAAYEAHPERFVNGIPGPPALPAEVWINQPQAALELEA